MLLPEVDRCPSCGKPLSAERCPECDGAGLAGLVQREAVVLAILVAITVATFFLTRVAAARDRSAAQHAAAAWFEAGHDALARGEVDRGIDSLRHAALNAAHNAQYRLALARALADNDRGDEARRILLKLRETAPESGDINLELGKLAARRGDVAEATRYYHHALYGIWDGGRVADPELDRALRTELIHFLLDRQQQTQALSQIHLLRQELPDRADAHAALGQLFLDAGSPSNALEHFARAIGLAVAPRRGEDTPRGPEDTKGDMPSSALVGAVRASFALRDYSRAGRYLADLRRTGDLPPRAAEVAPIVDAILTGDPLAPRLSVVERARRLTLLLDRAIARASACDAARRDPAASTALDEAPTLREQIRPAVIRRDPETVDRAFDLAVQLERAAEPCGDATVLDEALHRIAELHADTGK